MANITPTSLAAKPYDHQIQCPLFSVLPGEIRNEIFAYALVQYEDDDDAYPEDSYWYRPGFSGPRRSSSALLRTCRLAYLEGQKVFLRELEWAFWFDRGPSGRSGNSACKRFFRGLTPQQSQDLQKVRFFTQMYWLEGGSNLLKLFRQSNFRPWTLTITIRYSDWWYWEDDTPLRMSEEWLHRFVGPTGLRELKVEYETLSKKKDEMMKIVNRNKTWKLAMRDEEGHLSAEGTRLEEWKWNGTSRLGGKEWAHHGDGDTVEYVVVTDTWRYLERPMSEEDERRRADVLVAEHHIDSDWDSDESHDDDDDDEEDEEDDNEEDDDEEDDDDGGGDQEEEDEYGSEDNESDEDENLITTVATAIASTSPMDQAAASRLEPM